MPARVAIMDASSAIILFKVVLHQLAAELYDVVLPGSVYREITIKPYAGADAYALLVADQKMYVHEPQESNRSEKFNALGAGESDAIRLFQQGMGDFVMTDDGSAAKYCQKEGIPFINALLFPVVLRLSQKESDDFCHESMGRIIEVGRYSEEVVHFAWQCRKEDIAFALS